MDALSHHDIALFLLAVGVLIGVARIFGEVASRFGQPAVIGEIFAGVVLGPTVLGRLAPSWAAQLFPVNGPGAAALHGLTTLSITMFLLVAGLEIDLSTVWRRGRRALIVAGSGMVVPFTLGFAVAWWLPGLLGARPDAGRLVFALFMAIAVSISALPVIAKTLMDLNLFRTDVGITIIAAAVVNDLAGWLVFAVVLAMLGAAAAGPSFGIGATIALTVGFAVVMLSIGRKLVDRLLQWVQIHASWPGGVLGLALTLGLVGAAFTEWLGVHAIFGAFIVGVALGDSAHLRARTRATLEHFIGFVFAPLFFASLGLHVDFVANFDLGLCLVVVAITTVGKLVGCRGGAWLAGIPSREGWAIAFGMNASGAMGIILGLLALEVGLIDERLFVALVVMALASSMLSGPLISWVLRRARPLRLLDCLPEGGFLGQLAATTRREAIHELCAAAARAVGTDPAILDEAAWHREQLMATGLANRVAVPNARVAGLAQPVVVLGLSRRGIDFDAADGQTAQVVCLLLVPEDDAGGQWAILSDISATFARDEVRGQLASVTSLTELRALLKVSEQAEGRGHAHHGQSRQGCVVVGAGSFARAWARRLRELGCPVWLIDSNRNNVEAALREGLTAVAGNAAREVTLMAAHAFEARVLLALTPNAEANLEIARIARDTHGVPEALVVAPGLAANPEDSFLRAVEIDPDLLRGEHDELVARRIQRWEWVVVSEAAPLAEMMRTPAPAAVAFIPLVVERGGGQAAATPAWPGMPLTRGDTVHGLVVADSAEVDDPAVEVRRVFARAPILTIRGELSAVALLAQAAEALSVRLNLGVDRLVALFHEHGCDQAGPLTPELAVPHLRLDGAGQFELVICHAPEGVRFAGQEQRPTAVFVLVSTVDNRDLHLGMLAAIASIALRDDFTATWAGATDSESLRGWLIAALAELPRRR